MLTTFPVEKFIHLGIIETREWAEEIVCRFYLCFGIIVRMYKESSGKHNKAHVHAEYSGEEIVVALDGEILEGSFPKNKLKLLEAWMEIHQEDLIANWNLLSNGEQFFRIDPLK